MDGLLLSNLQGRVRPRYLFLIVLSNYDLDEKRLRDAGLYFVRTSNA